MRYSYTNVDNDIAKIRHETYLQLAANVAKKSTMTQKHGCVIVYKKEIIATGYNTMPVAFQESLHAEIDAIKKLKHRQYLLKDCELYIVRIAPDSLNNVLKYSKPCPNCTKVINFNKIRKVYYSTNFEYDRLKSTNCQDHDKSLLFQNPQCSACHEICS